MEGESSTADKSARWDYDKWNTVGDDPVGAPAQRPVINVSTATMNKVKELFVKYDQDGDKYLNSAEMHQLLLDTTGKPTTQDDYIFFCKALGGKPEKGLTIELLLLYYVGTGGKAAGGPDITADYDKVFAPTQGPAAPPVAPAAPATAGGAAGASAEAPGAVHVSGETTTKVAEIFAKYDQDGDQFLKHAEVRKTEEQQKERER
jgi:hypothetical protein